MKLSKFGEYTNLQWFSPNPVRLMKKNLLRVDGSWKEAHKEKKPYEITVSATATDINLSQSQRMFEEKKMVLDPFFEYYKGLNRTKIISRYGSF